MSVLLPIGSLRYQPTPNAISAASDRHHAFAAAACSGMLRLLRVASAPVSRSGGDALGLTSQFPHFSVVCPLVRRAVFCPRICRMLRPLFCGSGGVIKECVLASSLSLCRGNCEKVARCSVSFSCFPSFATLRCIFDLRARLKVAREIKRKIRIEQKWRPGQASARKVKPTKGGEKRQGVWDLFFPGEAGGYSCGFSVFCP